ncbi:hypothetical protein ACLVWU_04215 [Bdellovibrio sp. HCB290]|uniref:hypothetical protein n=1 Tax=Bdellovibrio sp. HCB290 TaxID=3394356 RepID=UPI0039B564A6
MVGVIVLLIGLQASAQVPYAQLELLRQQSVVVRVAMDTPNDPELKKCNLKSSDFAPMGGRLALSMDSASEAWESQNLTEADLAVLKGKIQACADRGSCQVYENYLSSVKPEPAIKAQTTKLIESLNEGLEKLESGSYQKAWKTVPAPCEVLKKLISQK